MAETSAVYSPQSGNLNAYTAGTGVPIFATQSGASKGCTLTPGTYYFPVGGERSEIPGGTGTLGIAIQWATAVAGTFALEAAIFPSRERAATIGPFDLTDYDNTSSGWLQWNSSASYIPIVGNGNTVTGTVITAGGTARGGALLEVSQLCARRVRIRAILTVGGLVRVGAHGKAL